MQDFFDAIAFSFKQISKQYMLRYILGSGTLITLFWLIVGVLFWDSFVAAASWLIELVPFSFIKSNSAMLFSAFLYMQTVLITFALLHAFGLNLYLQRSKRDNAVSLTLLLLFGSALFWGFVWVYYGGFIHTQLSRLFTWLPFETVEKTLSYLLGFYFLYGLSVASMIVAASLLSPSYLEELRQRECPYDTVYEKEESVLRYTLRDVGLFLLFSLLIFPLLFVPVLNVVAQLLLWVWLAKETLFYDSALMLFQRPSSELYVRYRPAVLGITLVGAFFNFVPVVHLFGPFFSEIAMFYYLKQKKEEQQYGQE